MYYKKNRGSLRCPNRGQELHPYQETKIVGTKVELLKWSMKEFKKQKKIMKILSPPKIRPPPGSTSVSRYIMTALTKKASLKCLWQANWQKNRRRMSEEGKTADQHKWCLKTNLKKEKSQEWFKKMEPKKGASPCIYRTLAKWMMRAAWSQLPEMKNHKTLNKD